MHSMALALAQAVLGPSEGQQLSVGHTQPSGGSLLLETLCLWVSKGWHIQRLGFGAIGCIFQGRLQPELVTDCLLTNLCNVFVKQGDHKTTHLI